MVHEKLKQNGVYQYNRKGNIALSNFLQSSPLLLPLHYDRYSEVISHLLLILLLNYV